MEARDGQDCGKGETGLEQRRGRTEEERRQG